MASRKDNQQIMSSKLDIYVCYQTFIPPLIRVGRFIHCCYLLCHWSCGPSGARQRGTLTSTTSGSSAAPTAVDTLRSCSRWHVPGSARSSELHIWSIELEQVIPMQCSLLPLFCLSQRGALCYWYSACPSNASWYQMYYYVACLCGGGDLKQWGIKSKRYITVTAAWWVRPMMSDTCIFILVL